MNSCWSGPAIVASLVGPLLCGSIFLGAPEIVAPVPDCQSINDVQDVAAGETGIAEGKERGANDVLAGSPRALIEDILIWGVIP